MISEPSSSHLIFVALICMTKAGHRWVFGDQSISALSHFHLPIVDDTEIPPPFYTPFRCR